MQVDHRGVVRRLYALHSSAVLSTILHAHSSRFGRGFWRGTTMVRQVYLPVSDCGGVQHHQEAESESRLSDCEVLRAVFRVLPVGSGAGEFDLLFG